MMTRKKGFERYFKKSKKWYRLVNVYENGTRRQRLEHRIIMENHFGRKLTKDEVVHHIDGDGLNNDISNLAVMTYSEHTILHKSGSQRWNMELAIKLREDGFSLAEIGRMLNVSWGSIRKIFIKHGIDTSDLGKGVYSWNVESIIEGYKLGKTISQLSKDAGISATSM